MNSLILCEGFTDYTLLQYYMRKACGWMDEKEIDETERGKRNQDNLFRFDNGKRKLESRRFFKMSGQLTIASAGGVSGLRPALSAAIQRNYAQEPGGEVFDCIVLFTDHDEDNTERTWENTIQDVLAERGAWGCYDTDQKRCCASMRNAMGEELCFNIYLLLIPEDHTGALETFLLDSIGREDAYDQEIIKKGKQLVNSADPEKRYLRKRRLITKAEFNVYFSIRTSAEQFGERQYILKNMALLASLWVGNVTFPCNHADS